MASQVRCIACPSQTIRRSLHRAGTSHDHSRKLIHDHFCAAYSDWPPCCS